MSESFFKGKRKSLPVQSHGEMRFIQQHLDGELKGIAQKHKKVSVSYNVEHGKPCAVNVQGDDKSCDEALSQMEGVVSAIHRESLVCRKPGMSKFFTSGEGRKKIELVESRHECAIEVESSGNNTSTASSNNVRVHVGDITSWRADALVNSIANDSKDLAGCGAVAKSFKQRGGASFTRDFETQGSLNEGRVRISSDTGSLSCRLVFHASLREWNGHGTKQVLQKLLDYIFEQAKEKNVTSMAIPTLGCGNLKYPPDVVGHCIAQAASRMPNIKVDIIVFKKDEIYNKISSAIAGQRVDSADLTVVDGSITERKADVLVNSVGSGDVSLSNCGVIAKAFLDKVGNALQKDFAKTNGIKTVGQVKLSGVATNLSCKLLVHFRIDKWTGTSSKSWLTEGIINVLREVKSRGYTSVSFPALGCGALNVPPRSLAACFLEASRGFKGLHIEVVSFKNVQVYRALSDAFEAQISSAPLSNVMVTVGDITKMKADILVNSVTDNSPELQKCGVVAKAYAQRGGKTLTDHYRNNGGLKELEVLRMGVATWSTFNARQLIHISIRAWKERDPADSKDTLLKYIEHCLNEADDSSMTSIAFPTIGCGGLNYPIKEVIDCFKTAAIKFPQIQILIVSYAEDGVYHTLNASFPPPDSLSPAKASTLRFAIYAKSQNHGKGAKHELEKQINDNYLLLQIDAEVLSKCNPQGPFMKELQKLENEQVSIFVDFFKCAVIVSGEKNAVVKTQPKVQEQMDKLSSEAATEGLEAALAMLFLGELLGGLAAAETSAPSRTPSRTSGASGAASGGAKKTQPKKRDCDYYNQCAEFLKSLKLSDAFFDKSHNQCFCEICSQDIEPYTRRGKPEKLYGQPMGWCRFSLRLHARAVALNVMDTWHRAYHGTKKQYLQKILEVGELVPAGRAVLGAGKVAERPGHFTPTRCPAGFDTKQVFLSPSLRYSGLDAYASPEAYQPSRGKRYESRVAFQVLVAPNSYKVAPETVGAGRTAIDPKIPNSELEWSTTQQGSTMLAAVLVKLE